MAAALVALTVLAVLTGSGSMAAAQEGATLEATTTPSPSAGSATPTDVDPNAPAAVPPLPTDAPLQSGLTPEQVAAATIPGPRPDPPTVTATGAVLFDPADGVLLAAVDPRTALPMASTTKIMTVMLALEALETGQVGPEVTVSTAAAATGQLPGVATLGLREGDVVPLLDLLAADLLQSGNDGAVAIAEHVAGSETGFVAMMNARAASLGLEDTGFVDASGLSDDPAHRATPLDLALLGQEAMTHPSFAAWAGSASLDVPPFGVLENRNELLTLYEGTTGIKTGFTSRAGLTLVASAEREGRTLYAVVLGSEDRVSDTIALFDHGFGDYTRPIGAAPDQPVGVYHTGAGDVSLSVAEPLTRTVGTGATLETLIRLAPDVTPPIAAGTPLGEIVLLVEGEETERLPLLADQDLADSAQGSPNQVGGPSTVGLAVADALRAFARLPERRAAVGAAPP